MNILGPSIPELRFWSIQRRTCNCVYIFFGQQKLKVSWTPDCHTHTWLQHCSSKFRCLRQYSFQKAVLLSHQNIFPDVFVDNPDISLGSCFFSHQFVRVFFWQWVDEFWPELSPLRSDFLFICFCFFPDLLDESSLCLWTGLGCVVLWRFF